MNTYCHSVCSRYYVGDISLSGKQNIWNGQLCTIKVKAIGNSTSSFVMYKFLLFLEVSTVSLFSPFHELLISVCWFIRWRKVAFELAWLQVHLLWRVKYSWHVCSQVSTQSQHLYSNSCILESSQPPTLLIGLHCPGESVWKGTLIDSVSWSLNDSIYYSNSESVFTVCTEIQWSPYYCRSLSIGAS